MLAALQGRWQTVHTGVALLRVVRGEVADKIVFSERTEVKLREMDSKEIAEYFKKVNPLDKAGACSIQSKRSRLLAAIRGSWANAVGLPVETLLKRLKRF